MDKMWICVDCVFRSEYHEKQNDAHEQDYQVAKQLFHKEPVVNVDEVTDFSKRPCGYCGSNLAGSRYSAILYEGVIK